MGNQITGGKVSFVRKFQPEQYGTRGAEAEISFVVEEGADLLTANEWFDRAGRMAQAKVMELVYAKPGAPTIQAATMADLKAISPEKASPEGQVLGALVVEADKKEGKEQAAAKLNAKDVAAKAKAAKGLEAIKANEAAAKTTDVDPFTDNITAAISTGEPRVDPDDLTELMGGLPSPAPVALTPKDCQDAVIKKMAAINNPKAIKVVIGKYVSLPQTITNIPVYKRAEFVAEIAALK